MKYNYILIVTSRTFRRAALVKILMEEYSVCSFGPSAFGLTYDVIPDLLDISAEAVQCSIAARLFGRVPTRDGAPFVFLVVEHPGHSTSYVSPVPELSTN